MSTEPAAVMAVQALIEDEDEGEQLDLLDPESARTEEARQVIAFRGPGRPKGARNKRTERTVRWLLARHRDPREALLAITDMHPLDLARLLGCKAIEAAQEIRLCAAAVLPYVAQRQPLAIDLTSRQALYLTIVEGGQLRVGGEPSLAAQILDLAPLSPARLEPVGQPPSDEEANDE